MNRCSQVDFRAAATCDISSSLKCRTLLPFAPFCTGARRKVAGANVATILYMGAFEGKGTSYGRCQAAYKRSALSASTTNRSPSRAHPSHLSTHNRPSSLKQANSHPHFKHLSLLATLSKPILCKYISKLGTPTPYSFSHRNPN